MKNFVRTPSTAPDLPVWPDAYLREGTDRTEIAERFSEAAVGKIMFISTEARVYGRSSQVRSHLHSFRPERITGDTKASWLTGEGRLQSKHPKKPTEDRPSTLYGLADVRDAVFIHEHGMHIGNAVRWCNDAAVMRQIAKLIGYDIKETP